MNRLRIIFLAAALIAALLAAYLSLGLLKHTPTPPAPQPAVIEKIETVDVLVAAQNLITGQQLGGFAVEWWPWNKDGVSPDMITKSKMPDALNQMAEARARFPLVVGEPIVAAKIVLPGDRGFMSAVLPNGMRAISIPINEVTAVSGFILPNDRVDLVLTRMVTSRSGEKTPLSDTVLTNVKVLAINQSLAAGDSAPTIADGRTAVLELEPQQAEIVTKILASGTITLVLRSLAEGGAAGLVDDRPKLSDSYQNPRRSSAGPLIIRYGLERSMPGQ